MNWHFDFLADHGVLSVKTSGDLNYEAILDLISTAAAEVKRRDCDKILVDHRDAVLKISPTRVYRLPAVGVAYGVDRRRKVAVVLSPSTIHEDEVRIYADVMNRNALPHRVFSDPEAALHWLVDSESSDA
ncbi:MAG: hypothetical protein ABW318_10350 [Vicinamibacterales bacterium]